MEYLGEKEFILPLKYPDGLTQLNFPNFEEELKSLLMKVRGEWKSWLKAQHSEN